MTLTVLSITVLVLVVAFIVLAARGANPQAFRELESVFRHESSASRSDLGAELARGREEFASNIDRLQSAVDGRVIRIEESVGSSLEKIREATDQKLEVLRRDLLDRQDQIRAEAESNRRTLREEITTSLQQTSEVFGRTGGELVSSQRERLDALSQQVGTLVDSNERRLTTMQSGIEQRLVGLETRTTEGLEKSRVATEQKFDGFVREISEAHNRMRDEAGLSRKQHREEIARTLGLVSESLEKSVDRFSATHKTEMDAFGLQIRELVAGNDQRFETLRSSIDTRLAEIRDHNAQQLEQMRQTVDEKLQGTLERRLGESFKQVSEHLEQVQRGLGEMQTLAANVGDFKRMLTNVKSRGGWGEVQLGALLDQILAPEQYVRNFRVREDSQQSVEFAIALPVHGDRSTLTYLPIDAKFPMEDYQRLVDVQEKGDREAVEVAVKALEQRLEKCASDISQKYIEPPLTTNFAFMYLPNEGLFAEAIRRPGLVEKLQREYRVTIAGPTTLAAHLNMIQMGFRSLAIEKQSTEVWNLLGAVKTQFDLFGGVLARVKKQLNTATKSIDEVGTRTRAIQRRLRSVEELPKEEAELLLPETTFVDEEAEDSDNEGDTN